MAAARACGGGAALVTAAAVVFAAFALLAAGAPSQSQAGGGACDAIIAKSCGGVCQGYPTKGEECEEAKKGCATSICDPICSRMAFEVSFDVACGGAQPARCARLKEELGGELGRAMGNYLVVAGCDMVMQCCAKPPVELDMYAEAEDRAYAGVAPLSPLMLPACSHAKDDAGEAADVCAMCKQAVKTQVAPRSDCGAFPSQAKPSSMDKFTQSTVMMPQQVPADHAFSTRCRDDFSPWVSGQFGAMKAAFDEKICSCLGCCGDNDADRCFYTFAGSK